MFICRLFDREGILRKTLELERFTEYLSVPEKEIIKLKPESTTFKSGNPQSQFVFSHIISKSAHHVECHYAQR